MSIPLELSFRHMNSSPFIDNTVREHLQRIDHLCSRATGCHVSVGSPHTRQRKGRLYEVHIELRVPGEPLVVSEHVGKNGSHENLAVAIRDGFNALERQLERWKEKPRDAHRSPAASAARNAAFAEPIVDEADLVSEARRPGTSPRHPESN